MTALGIDALLWAALAGVALNGALLLALLLRRPRRPHDVASRGDVQQLERELRREAGEQARASRQELSQSLVTFQDAVMRQAAEATRTQNAQIDAFAQQLAQLRGALSETLTQQLSGLSEANARRIQEVRGTLEQQLGQ
jgi:DNA recombination protein RmuC